MANIKQVAQAARLSVSSVSKYLKNPETVSARSRARIEAAIQTLNYTPSTAARALRTKHTNAVKLLTESVRNPFYAQIFDELQQQFWAKGYTLTMQVVGRGELSASDFRGVDGVVIGMPESERTISRAMEVLDAHTPVALIHWRALAGEAAQVLIDMRGGIYTATEYLLRLDGGAPPYYVGGQRADTIAAEKYRGYAECLAEYRLTPDPARIYSGDYSFQSGYYAAQEIAQRGELPAGVVCENDIIAAGVVRGLYDQDIRVPDTVRVTGFDNIDMARYMMPALTSVSIPIRELCHATCDLLLRRMEGQAVGSVTYTPELIVRQT